MFNKCEILLAPRRELSAGNSLKFGYRAGKLAAERCRGIRTTAAALSGGKTQQLCVGKLVNLLGLSSRSQLRIRAPDQIHESDSSCGGNIFPAERGRRRLHLTIDCPRAFHPLIFPRSQLKIYGIRIVRFLRNSSQNDLSHAWTRVNLICAISSPP